MKLFNTYFFIFIILVSMGLLLVSLLKLAYDKLDHIVFFLISTGLMFVSSITRKIEILEIRLIWEMEKTKG